MKKALLLLAFTPSMALAQERTYNCEVPKGALPEMAVTLVTLHDGKAGHIIMDGEQKEASVYPGLDSITFLMFSDDYSYTLHYNMNLENGDFDFSASGAKSGWGRGTCTEVMS
ncbi:hypothetical protein [Aliiroseovarius sp. F20344]|uniref:hypothetical protein n=1 Tax=Aliiroseovarius sp. F20344 TaxID=2926414 RepID=UPI001FF50C28|nr:hypothetical protein [Aliiroseovarius sp. F20344]MCK0143030.1 hypothetical protein [Aliiroseovarius sp. F20344]